MKTLSIILRIFSAAELGASIGRGLRMLATSLGWMMILCGIALAKEPPSGAPNGTDRPKSYFRKAEPKSLPLLQQSKDDAKPKSWFRKDEPTVAAQPTPIDDADEFDAAPVPADDPGPPIPQRKPTHKPAVEPANMPSTHHRPKSQTMTAALSQAVTFYDDLPRDLLGEGTPQAAIEGVVYMPVWCVLCWSSPGVINPSCPVNPIKDDSRFTITLKANELPAELLPKGKRREDMRYPLIHFKSVNRVYPADSLTSPDAVMKSLDHAALLAGTSLCPLNAADATVVARFNERDLPPYLQGMYSTAITSVKSFGDGLIELNPVDQMFERGPMQGRIPAGTKVRGIAEKGGIRFAFPEAIKAQVRHEKWFRPWHDVRYVSLNTRRIVVQCTWKSLWYQFCIEVDPA